MQGYARLCKAMQGYAMLCKAMQGYARLCKAMQFLFLFLSLVKVSDDTRSAWRYCNTRATLGRGDKQAYQDQGRGLNNSLKLM